MNVTILHYLSLFVFFSRTGLTGPEKKNDLKALKDQKKYNMCDGPTGLPHGQTHYSAAWPLIETIASLTVCATHLQSDGVDGSAADGVLTESENDALFDMFDKDGSGKLSKDEFFDSTALVSARSWDKWMVERKDFMKLHLISIPRYEYNFLF